MSQTSPRFCQHCGTPLEAEGGKTMARILIVTEEPEEAED